MGWRRRGEWVILVVSYTKAIVANGATVASAAAAAASSVEETQLTLKPWPNPTLDGKAL